MVMNLLFLLLGPTSVAGVDPKIANLGPKMAKHDKLVKVPKWLKNGPKWSKIVNISIFDYLETFLVHLDNLLPLW